VSLGTALAAQVHGGADAGVLVGAGGRGLVQQVPGRAQYEVHGQYHEWAENGEGEFAGRPPPTISTDVRTSSRSAGARKSSVN
jgi:hypothetical protein